MKKVFRRRSGSGGTSTAGNWSKKRPTTPDERRNSAPPGSLDCEKNLSDYVTYKFFSLCKEMSNVTTSSPVKTVYLHYSLDSSSVIGIYFPHNLAIQAI